ncbi:hypothetical protein PO654_14015 [Phytobacter diazotrophicus]|jgi:hypothetical protein|uniref:Uncharacterized protein n=1 Tax=Phytobacter diazotrophicus TaxID=395631 RepID=A0ABN6LSJ7_9ENTR|nr:MULTISPECIES: hypothetical protein [Phytobacter]MDU4154359.1 hypothetical protein [Enterobacteriaceae bacterium]PTA90394.1 hypothetical protein C9415_22580 [Kluyvera sp. Nf5]QIH63353.1 hypothetical protein CRX67_09605 [Enterobacteriaceae bacterium A-F18]MDU4994976.1 hypothetical protein [Enterobacteriaceae bacterium]QIH64298.1 hypothetical protein CRX67_15060 [Enterobacteriaceae bacterium A-F18]
MNCQIKKVIVSISSLGSKLSGEHLTVHVYASNEAEKLLVGRLDFVGKTDSVFKRSLNVICPDGFELSAIAVDELGVPHPFNDSWGITVADDLHYPRGGFLTPEKAMSKELSGDADASISTIHLATSCTGINPLSTAIKLSDEMRDAVIAAVRDSGQFVEKPTGDEQQSVVFRADRFKVTVEVNDSGEPTIQRQIQQAANAVIEATKAALTRQDAAMADLASAQAAITEHINQVVNNALANALKPGGVLYGLR